MADVFDYLKWRGDLRLAQDGMNPIDAVILSRLSYLQFDGIVPVNEKMSLRDAAECFFADAQRSEQVLWKGDAELLQACADSARFGDLLLSDYVNIIDGGSQMQFCALTITLDSDRLFLSYRGTDNTLVGWREDFDMFSHFPLPSQEKALAYFQDIAARFPGRFVLGGHSKGGNLAVYASAFCTSDLRERVDAVYSMDGPGFETRHLADSGFYEIRDRIHTYVPQSSVFGMLLEHQEQYTVVQSHRKGFLQHDIYSWEVEGTRLVTLPDTTATSVYFDRTLSDFIGGISSEERERLADGVFEILAGADVMTFDEIADSLMRCVGKFLGTMKHMDGKTRSLIMRQLGRLLKTAGKNLSHVNPLRRQNRRSKTQRQHAKRIKRSFKCEKRLRKITREEESIP